MRGLTLPFQADLSAIDDTDTAERSDEEETLVSGKGEKRPWIGL
jgi:hypothetical protein